MPDSGKTDYSAVTGALGHFLLKAVRTGTYRFGTPRPAICRATPCLPGVRFG